MQASCPVPGSVRVVEVASVQDNELRLPRKLTTLKSANNRDIGNNGSKNIEGPTEISFLEKLRKGQRDELLSQKHLLRCPHLSGSNMSQAVSECQILPASDGNYI